MSFASIGPVINTQSRILASPSGANRVADEATLSQILDFIGSAAQGDILYRDSSAWARLGAGTSGQFLKTHGASANPAWGSAMPLLNSGTLSSASSLAIVLTSFSAYRGFRIVLGGFRPATDSVSLKMRFSTNGGSSYDSGSSDYRWALFYLRAATSNDQTASSSDSSIALNRGDNAIYKFSNGSTAGGDYVIELLNCKSTSQHSRVSWSGVVTTTTSGEERYCAGFGKRLAAQDTDSVSIFFDSGNIAEGEWSLYGYP